MPVIKKASAPVLAGNLNAEVFARTSGSLAVSHRTKYETSANQRTATSSAQQFEPVIERTKIVVETECQSRTADTPTIIKEVKVC